MRFVGQTEVAAFLGSHPGQAEWLQAWLAEIRHRKWDNADALSADFPKVDISKPPLTVFQLGKPPVQIETVIDFRNSVVLLLTIQQLTALSNLVSSQYGNA